MTQKIAVRVVEFADRNHYQLQWNCPDSGRKKTKSSGIRRTGKRKDRAEAERVAAKLEAQLEAGQDGRARRITWEAFRDRFELEVSPAKAANTRLKISAVFNAVERLLNPAKLASLTAERLSYFQSELRREGKAEASIKSDLATIKAALGWAVRMKLMHEVPAIEMPTRAGDKMKGRPITGEEYDRLIAAVEKVAKPVELEPVKRLIRGLWLSGLRLNEALNLYWDRDDQLRIEMAGRRPMLRIPAGMDKSGKGRMLPITPDFAEFLVATPVDNRRGHVFPQLSNRSRSAVSHLLAAVGERAGIKVEETPRGVKYASAHDLRRSFGERWAALVMPNVLQELMRHETITTTMKFYVGRNAERTADLLWAAHGKAVT